jgi:DNA (cytosine-5)-methyltransferase 1
MAFEEVWPEACIVRGPDLLWGGDIRRFHPPAGRFDGIIGGPPCQAFSGLANFSYRWKHAPEDLVPEFSRVVTEAAPAWFVMENVPKAPLPDVPGYVLRPVLLNNRMFGAAQARERRITFGTPHGARLDRHLVTEAARHPINGEHHRTVTAAHGGGRPRMRGNIERVTVEEAVERQGLPDDFFGDRSPFRRDAQQKMVIQGVPMPMGRAVAKAVKRALEPHR